MEVNKLESREVLVMLFGLPVMITLIVLASIGVGHWVTTRSDRPTNVTIAPSQPKIEVNVPPAQVNVAPATPNVDVTVPSAPPPTINVSTPPAVVTVVHRTDERAELPPLRSEPKTVPARVETPVPPAATKPAVPKEAPKETAKEAPSAPSAPPAPKADPAKIPDLPPAAKASYAPEATKAPQLALREEDLTLDTLYKYAERYIESYCQKRSLDPAQEAKKWQTKWKQGLEQSMRDNTDQDEQAYINRIVVIKRDCFDIEKATPEKIVEGCRIMLRYRDGQFAWLQAMKDAITQDNMKKTLVFLAAGVQ